MEQCPITTENFVQKSFEKECQQALGYPNIKFFKFLDQSSVSEYSYNKTTTLIRKTNVLWFTLFALINKSYTHLHPGSTYTKACHKHPRLICD